MPDQHGFEGLIEVGHELEIVEWHKGDELHVLNEGPKRKERHLLVEQYKELQDDDGNHHVVQRHGHVSVEGHFLI